MNCPKCGKEMVKRNGKKGEFMACAGYPECKHTANIGASEAPAASTSGGSAKTGSVLNSARLSSATALAISRDGKEATASRVKEAYDALEKAGL